MSLFTTSTHLKNFLKILKINNIQIGRFYKYFLCPYDKLNYKLSVRVDVRNLWEYFSLLFSFISVFFSQTLHSFVFVYIYYNLCCIINKSIRGLCTTNRYEFVKIRLHLLCKLLVKSIYGTNSNYLNPLNYMQTKLER